MAVYITRFCVTNHFPSFHQYPSFRISIQSVSKVFCLFWLSLELLPPISFHHPSCWLPVFYYLQVRWSFTSTSYYHTLHICLDDVLLREIRKCFYRERLSLLEKSFRISPFCSHHLLLLCYLDNKYLSLFQRLFIQYILANIVAIHVHVFSNLHIVPCCFIKDTITERRACKRLPIKQQDNWLSFKIPWTSVKQN